MIESVIRRFKNFLQVVATKTSKCHLKAAINKSTIVALRRFLFCLQISYAISFQTC